MTWAMGAVGARMDNISLAAQAVAKGPMTSAPPSFEGHGWLVAINLAAFTAAFIISAMLARDQVFHLWRNRARDRWGDPVTIWRIIGLCLFAAGTLRFGSAAAMLWKWNPYDPAGTAWVLTLQRFIDPVAVALGLTAFLLYTLSSPGLTDQLRRRPLVMNIWLSMPMLRRPALILALSVVASVLVVTLR